MAGHPRLQFIMTVKKKSAKEIREEKEAKALQKNLEKRKLQIKAREEKKRP
jgi:hypothetical protein